MDVYELLTEKAELSAAHAERWKLEHDAAMSAWLVSDLYDEAHRLFQRWVQVDAERSEDLANPLRERGLRALLRLVEALGPRSADAATYGHAVSAQQLEQLAAHVKLMLAGKKVHDPASEQRALAEVEAGRAVNLGELRRRLRDRRP
jgi:hypothetical protein